jgi:hypothetical protein
VSHKRELIEQEIDLWNQYQTGVKALTPWLEKTEMVVQMEASKPNSLQETVVQLNSAKVSFFFIVPRHRFRITSSHFLLHP